MREIKFRAWDKATHKMWQWEDHNAFSTNNGSIKEWFTDKDLVLMQYTGLKDKNGVEIFEGDICRHHYFKATGQISWINAAFKLLYTDAERDDLLPIDMEWFEVIGNIYENKELLK